MLKAEDAFDKIRERQKIKDRKKEEKRKAKEAKKRKNGVEVRFLEWHPCHSLVMVSCLIS